MPSAFPSLEWPAIRAAVGAQAGDISPWTEWCHQEAARISLPAGVWTTCDRGAEQGDPLGSLYCALVLSDCAAAAAAAVRAAGHWVADFWFADDGQVVLPPDAVELYLRTFDASLSAVGGTRIGTDGKVKSTVKLLGPLEGIAATPGEWCTAYVSSSCKIVQNGRGGLVLGVGITATEGRELWAAAATDAARARAALPLVDDPAAELSLLRMCMDGCRLTHLLRGLGPDLQEQDLADADHAIEESLSTLLRAPLDPCCLTQASVGARGGGLGLRSTLGQQLPAFLASRIESFPLARELGRALPENVRGPTFARWQEGLAAAESAWLDNLPVGIRGAAEQVLRQGEKDANLFIGRTLGLLPMDESQSLSPSRAAAGIILDGAAADDPEHPDSSGQARLQTRLCDLLAGVQMGELRREFELKGDWPALRRLDDLRAEGTDHTWLWAVSQGPGGLMLPEDFCRAVCLRLGADVIPADISCSCCGERMDKRGLHALRCAPGESTRGHNRTRDTLLGLASLADPTSCAEPRGLIPSRPGLRPADLLTTAAFARLAALDVGIVCPDSAGCGADACSAMVSNKLSTYASVLPELDSEGVSYYPMVWSCWGRPHCDADAAIRSMAAAAARRRGIPDSAGLARRCRSLIGVQIWRRAARMVAACLPCLPSADAPELLDGAIAAVLSDDESTDDVSCLGSEEAAAAASAGAACEAFAAASGAACSGGSGSRAPGQPSIVEKSDAWQLGAG